MFGRDVRRSGAAGHPEPAAGGPGRRARDVLAVGSRGRVRRAGGTVAAAHLVSGACSPRSGWQPALAASPPVPRKITAWRRPDLVRARRGASVVPNTADEVVSRRSRSGWRHWCLFGWRRTARRMRPACASACRVPGAGCRVPAAAVGAGYLPRPAVTDVGCLLRIAHTRRRGCFVITLGREGFNVQVQDDLSAFSTAVSSERCRRPRRRRHAAVGIRQPL